MPRPALRSRPLAGGIARPTLIRARAGGCVALAFAGAIAWDAPAAAQVIERHLPPAPPRAAAPLPTPAAPAIADDAAPIGPPLAALVALAPAEAVRAAPAPGLDLHAVPRLDTPRARLRLRAYLGRPISRRLIDEIAADITRLYRHAGFPFVAVSTPEQEITRGALQLRVVEFVAGRIIATPAPRTPPVYVEERVRLGPGDPIDARALAEDLAWLNRNPFRHVEATFSPGTAFGETDVDLQVTAARPWQVYGGYASSGSAASGRDRLLAGFQAAGPSWARDALLSYQFTAAPGGDRDSRYGSHAVRLSLPLSPRRALEFTYDHVATRQPVQAFDSRQQVDEAALGYRASLGTLGLARVPGDLRLGIEARRAGLDVLFGDTAVLHTTYHVVQAYAGYAASFSDGAATLGLDVALHAGPGTRGGAEASATGAARGGSAYVYLNGRAALFAPLPRGFGLSSELLVQIASAALPQTEQIAIGGPSLVRGYLLDDGAFDSAVVVRTTLSAPALRLLPRAAKIADALTPLLFVDAGYGAMVATRRHEEALAVGLGVEYRLGATVQAGVSRACALRSAGATRAGRCRFEGRVTIAY